MRFKQYKVAGRYLAISRVINIKRGLNNNQDGENGFLFDSTSEAQEILSELQQDSAKMKQVKAAARATAESVASAQSARQLLDYFTRPLADSGP